MSGTPAPQRNGTVRVRSLQLQVSGLVELRAMLRALEDGLPKELQGVNKGVVNDLLVPRARAGAEAHRPTSGYNARTGRSRFHWADVVNSIRGTATQTSAAILFGSTARNKNFMVGFEFGSLGINKPPHSNKSQFPPSPGSGKNAGRFFFPAIRQSGPEIVTAYVAALERFVAARVPQG